MRNEEISRELAYILHKTNVRVNRFLKNFFRCLFVTVGFKTPLFSAVFSGFGLFQIVEQSKNCRLASDPI